MGARGSRAWGPCDGHGKGAWGGGESGEGGAGRHAPGPLCMGGGGGVRAGRAERAGMHRGPLKESDRST